MKRASRLTGLLLIIACSLLLCSSKHINCTSDITSNGTLYRVPKFKASNCYYSWANKSGHVVANKMKKSETIVIRCSEMEILTYQCHEEMKYMRTCPSEGEEITAECNMTCAGPADREKGALDPTHKIIIIISSISIVVGVVLLAFFIFRRGDRRCFRGDYHQGARNDDVEDRL